MNWFGVFLVIGVDPLLLVVVGLLSLNHKSLLSDSSESLLELSVVQDLKPPDSLHLEGLLPGLLSLSLPSLRIRLNLALSLIEDSLLLLLAESLHVIGLVPVRSKHADLSLGVLSHEIIGLGVVDLIGIGLLLPLPLLGLPLLPLISQLLVGLEAVLLVLEPESVVL